MRVYNIVRGILSWLVGGILIALLGEFAIELAREHGAFEHPTDRVVAVMGVLAAIKDLFWFWPTVVLMAGLVIGMWLGALFRGHASGGDISKTPGSLSGDSPDYSHGLALQDIRLSLDMNNPKYHISGYLRG